MPLQRLSLRHKLPLFLIGLTTTALVVAGVIAWREVRGASIAAAETRVARTTRDLAELIARSLPARDSVVQSVTRDPALARALGGRLDTAAVMAALDTLRRAADGSLPIQLRSADRAVLLELGRAPAGDTVQPGPFAAEVRYGPFRRVGGETLFWVTYPIGEGPEPSGWVAQRQRLGSPQTAQTLATLLGDSLTLVIGHLEHDTWATWDGSLVPPPAAGHPFDTVFTTAGVGGAPALALATGLPGTPWALMSQLPLAAVNVRPRAFVARMIQVGLGLLVVVFLLGLALSRRLTAPIQELAVAADVIAAGGYGQRVRAEGIDELARLGTAFNAMSEQVARAHEELRQRLLEARALAERLEDANAQAQAAREAAQHASRAKSDFLATMSHEIRTPINAVIGYTELLQQGIPDAPTPAQSNYLQRIEQSSRHLITLVSEVLDFARIESGQLTVRGEEGVAAEAIQAARTALEPQARQKGVSLSAECACEEGVVYLGDPHRVQQILLNLVSNAVKFTRPGGSVRLTCSTTDEGPSELPANGGWVRADVEDTGVGIPPDQLGRMFEPFVQGEGGITREHGGVGLGLAISQRLAQLQGGTITARSEEGRGSRFTLWLRAARKPEQAKVGAA